MKKAVILLAMFVLGTGVSFAANNLESEPTTSSSLVQEIKSLLKSPKFDFADNKETKAMVSFTINNKNEIVVISVDSKNELVEGFVKTRLNYKKLNNKSLLKGKIYKMPLKIKNS